MLLVPAILLTQVVVCASPGRSLCIVLDACCGQHGPHGHEHDHDRERDHEHVHVIASAHPASHRVEHRRLRPGCAEVDVEEGCDGSGGHFHIVVPDDAGTPRTACATSIPLVDASVLELPDSMLAEPAAAGESARTAKPPPWIWPSCDQRRAIATDRLLI